MGSGTMQRRRVTLLVDGAPVFEHTSVGSACDRTGAVDLAVQVWLLGRDRSELRGKKITATVDDLDDERWCHCGDLLENDEDVCDMCAVAGRGPIDELAPDQQRPLGPEGTDG